MLGLLVSTLIFTGFFLTRREREPHGVGSAGKEQGKLRRIGRGLGGGRCGAQYQSPTLLPG